MKNYKIVFSNLDGTLIDTITGEKVPKGVWDMKINFSVLDFIKNEIKPEYICIITNQGMVEYGLDEDILVVKLNYVMEAVGNYCNAPCYAYYSISNDETNKDRKPNVGMLDKFLMYLALNKNKDYNKTDMCLIGDNDIDKETAENYGIDHFNVEDILLKNKENYEK